MAYGPKQREYQRQYRLKNRERKLQYDRDRYERRKEYILAGTKRRRQENRLWLAEHKKKPCLDCGGEFPHPVMEFHHRDPDEKSFTIGMNLGSSRERLLKEMAKCDLLCANCHRIRTHVAKEGRDEVAVEEA